MMQSLYLRDDSLSLELRRWQGLVIIFMGLSIMSCEPAAPEPQAVSLPPTYNDKGEFCGSGLAIIETDYLSTNLSIYDLEGKSAAPRFFSSASAPSSLNAPLSGDVVLPSRLNPDDFVVIDRAQSVLTRLSLATGLVEAQVSVGDDFFANPHDYLRVEEKALVTRFEANPKSQENISNQGDDVVHLDWPTRKVIETISSNWDTASELSPDRFLLAGKQLWVSSLGFSSGFTAAADARWFILGAQSLEVEQQLVARGLRNCTGLALSPSGRRIAISCTGLFADANQPSPAESALLLFERNAQGQWQEAERIEAQQLAAGPFGFDLDFASEDLIISTAFGALEGEDAGRPDRIVQWFVDTGAAKLIGQPQKAFSLGSPDCSAACEVCFIADAESFEVIRFAVATPGLEVDGRFTLASGLGLAPRQVRIF